MVPTTSAQYLPVVSQAISEYAANLESQFMGKNVLPIFGTDEKTATMPKFPIGNVTKTTGNLKRAPKAGYDRIENKPGSFTFECEEYGIEEPIDDSDKKYLARFIGNLVDDGQLRALMLRRQQEKRIAALTFNATTFAGYTANVSAEWSTITTKIVDDVQDTILTLKQQLGGVIGLGQMNLAVSEKVFRNMMKNTQIQAQRGGKNGASRKDGADPIAADEMAMILGVDNVYFSPAQDNATDIWDDEYALLYMGYGGTSLKSVPHIGRTMLWREDSPTDLVAEMYRDEAIRSAVFRVRQSLDEVVFTPAAGYLLSNITA